MKANQKKVWRNCSDPRRAKRTNNPGSPLPDRNPSPVRNQVVPLDADVHWILGDFFLVRFISKNQRGVGERAQKQMPGADLHESRAVSIDFGRQITQALAASVPEQPG